MLISLSRVTSWFDTICNIVKRWVNFRKNQLHFTIIRQQYLEVFLPKMNKFLVEKYIFQFFLCTFQGQNEKL